MNKIVLIAMIVSILFLTSEAQRGKTDAAGNPVTRLSKTDAAGNPVTRPSKTDAAGNPETRPSKTDG